MPRLRLGTWNLHSWVGAGGKRQPQRAMRVLGGMDPDVLALQEASMPTLNEYAPAKEFLEKHTGLYAGIGFTLVREDAHFGNALLSKLPYKELRNHDISYSGREPRGVIEAVIETGGATVQIMATHLGLRSRERLRQAETILDLAQPKTFDCIILMGDFNEWHPASKAMQRLRTVFATPATPRTFPARLPLLALDRILATPNGVLQNVAVFKDHDARLASDHLPLVAELAIGQ